MGVLRRWALGCVLVLLASCTSTSGQAQVSSTSAVPSASPTTATSSAAPTPTTLAPSASTTLPNLVAPADPAPASATEQLLDDLAGEDKPTVQQAVDAFSLSVAPLPGASTSSLPTGDGLSPTVAWQMILAQESALTPAQAAIVDALYAAKTADDSTATNSGSPVSTSASPSGSPTRSGSATPSGTTTATTHSSLRHRGAALVAAASRSKADLRTLLDQATADWRAKHPELIGRVKGIRLNVASAPSGKNYAMDTVFDKKVDDGCIITVYPDYLILDPSDAYVKFDFAHELFHCIQLTWNKYDYREWLDEGSAEFAAMDLYRTTYDPTWIAYQGWFSRAGRALGTDPAGKGYNDWALFEAFRVWYSIDPYPAIEAMVENSGTTADTVAAGHFDNPIFASVWTSTSLRSTSYSDGVFHFDWPGIQPDFGDATTHNTAQSLGTAAVGDFDVVAKGDFAHQQYTVSFNSSVGVVGVTPSTEPMLTHADAGAVSVGEGLQSWFCVAASGCTCPDGWAPNQDFIPLTPPMLFSFGASAAIPQAAVITQPWDPNRFCHLKNTTDDSAAGGATGTSNGDPHVTTFNGLAYDFMTYGEFVTSQDSTGGFTVQERHQQAGFGTAVSAVAVGDGSHRITFTAASISSSAAITVKVDGQVSTATTATAGGLSLTSDTSTGESSWTVTWPDGSVVNARWADGFFLTVSPAPARSPHLVGLLGTPGLFLNDLNLPDGSRADPLDNYASFAKAYQITAATSLFDYAPGESPETFTKVPAAVKPVVPTPATFSGCRSGLGDAATASEVNACAFDATSLGDLPTFTAAYTTTTQQRSSQVVTTPATPRPSRIVVGTTGAPTASALSPSSSAPAGGPSLTLSGTVPTTGDNPLTGPITLAAGTVLVARTQCPADPGIDVEVTVASADGSQSASTWLCGPQWNGGGSAGSAGNATARLGESYLFVYQSAAETVSVQALYPTGSGATASVPLTVQLDSSRTPTVITPTDLPVGASKTVTLNNVGDTIAMDVVPGHNGGTWTFTGADALCTQVYYIAALHSVSHYNADDLSATCWQHAEIDVGPSDSALPILVFDRDGNSATVTVTRTK